MEEKIKVILLIGSGHSGSTLFDLIMNSHPNIVGVGGLSRGTRVINRSEYCSCGKIVKECSFWSKILPQLSYPNLDVSEKFIDFLFNRKRYYSYKSGIREVIDEKEYIKRNEEVYEMISKVSAKKVIFESSKNPIRAYILTKSKNIDVILIHLVRDCMGVTYSNVKHGRYAYKAAAEWVKTNIKSEIVKLKSHNTESIIVNYTNLVNNTELQISKILNAVGLKYNNQMASFHEEHHHLISGNEMRYKVSGEIQEDLRWKIKLKRRDKLVVFIIAGWLNFYYRITG